MVLVVRVAACDVLLDGVDTFDPTTLIAMLVGVAVVAGYLSARRATHVDPAIALQGGVAGEWFVGRRNVVGVC